MLSIGLLFFLSLSHANYDLPIPISIFINEERLITSNEPFLKEGRVFVPVRDIAEAFGATVTWHPYERAVVIDTKNQNKAPALPTNDKDIQILINDNFLDLSDPPIQLNNRIYLPLRAIGEALEAKVQWDAPYKQIKIKITQTSTLGTHESEYVIQSGPFHATFENGISFLGEVSTTDRSISGLFSYQNHAFFKLSSATYPEFFKVFDLNWALNQLVIGHAHKVNFKEVMPQFYESTLSLYPLNKEMIGIYVEDLSTGLSWTIGNELVFDPYNKKTKGKFSASSAIKFPMAFAVLSHLRENQMPLNTSFVDALSGRKLVLSDVLRNAVSKSVNAHYNFLLRYLGQNKANAYLFENGVLNSTINTELGGGDPYWTLERMKEAYGTYNVSRFTPEDYGKLLKIVYEKTREGDSYMAFLNQLLLENIYSSRIPRGIGYLYPVAHKTGTHSEIGRFADVGIVYHPQHPYVIVILLDGQENIANCEPFMRSFVSKVHSYLTGNAQ